MSGFNLQVNIPIWLGKRFTVYDSQIIGKCILLTPWLDMIWSLVPPCTPPHKFSRKVSRMYSFIGSSFWKKIPPYLREGYNMVNEGLHKNLSIWKYKYLWMCFLPHFYKIGTNLVYIYIYYKSVIIHKNRIFTYFQNKFKNLKK